jgi:hypothetical protein
LFVIFNNLNVEKSTKVVQWREIWRKNKRVRYTSSENTLIYDTDSEERQSDPQAKLISDIY